jgi:hypothetical protein
MGAGGNVLVPLSRYADTEFDVYACPVDREITRLTTLELLRDKIDYDIADLLRIALHNALRFKLPNDTGGLICSAYSARIYKFAGWLPCNMPSIPSPSDVVAALAAMPNLTVNP